MLQLLFENLHLLSCLHYAAIAVQYWLPADRLSVMLGISFQYICITVLFVYTLIE